MVKIAVAITATDRKDDAHRRSIPSAQKAFGDRLRVFFDGAVDYSPGCPYIINRNPLGCWKNWISSLDSIYRENVTQDYYGVLQDDVIFADNLLDYLQSLKLPKIFSVFKPGNYIGPERWVKRTGADLWMAQTLFFDNKTTFSLLKNNFVWRVPGNKQVDNRIGLFSEYIGEPVHYHNPSLAQHIGGISTLWDEKATLSGDRVANDFVGENYNCLLLGS